MVQIGDKVRFVPGGMTDDAHERLHDPVTGTVISVNQAHRHYTVEASVGEGTLRRSFRECFKFSATD